MKTKLILVATFTFLTTTSAFANYNGQSVPLEVVLRNQQRAKQGLPPVTLHGPQDRGAVRPVDSRGIPYRAGTGTRPWNPRRY